MNASTEIEIYEPKKCTALVRAGTFAETIVREKKVALNDGTKTYYCFEDEGMRGFGMTYIEQKIECLAHSHFAVLVCGKGALSDRLNECREIESKLAELGIVGDDKTNLLTNTYKHRALVTCVEDENGEIHQIFL